MSPHPSTFRSRALPPFIIAEFMFRQLARQVGAASNYPSKSAMESTSEEARRSISSISTAQIFNRVYRSNLIFIRLISNLRLISCYFLLLFAYNYAVLLRRTMLVMDSRHLSFPVNRPRVHSAGLSSPPPLLISTTTSPPACLRRR